MHTGCYNGQMAKKVSPLRERLDARTVEQDGHLLWTGYCNRRGYGQMSIRMDDGRWLPRPVHRVAWFLYYGQWPEHTIDHLDRFQCPKNCVNVAHLEDVPILENQRRSIEYYGGNHNSLKTHCKKGHEFTEENTYWFTRSDGGQNRQCKTCQLLFKQNQRGPEKPIHVGPRRKLIG